MEDPCDGRSFLANKNTKCETLTQQSFGLARMVALKLVCKVPDAPQLFHFTRIDSCLSSLEHDVSWSKMK